MSDGLWTAYEAAAATGGALCARGGGEERWAAEDWSAAGLSIDTRTLKPGELFVALSDKRDGHEFLRVAFERGAAAALVARAPDDAPDGAPLLVVRDTMEGLRDLARAARLRNFGVRIAVTGSAGKTSTKEMLKVAFGARAKAHAADKSFNNHLGVPLTLAELPLDADYGVFEIGMNHAGEITPLVKLVKPHFAIVTTIAPAHLENLGSMEGIADAKAEIFSGLLPGGAAILPADSAYFPRLLMRANAAGVGRVVTFGEAATADVRMLSYQDGETGGDMTLSLFGAPPRALTIGAPGKHQAMNALAVLATVSLAHAPLEPAIDALRGLGAAQGRGARREVRLGVNLAITLIDESYNANPASMRAALSLLGSAKPRGAGRRVAALGDMLELGPDAPTMHAALAEAVVAARVDRIYTAGPLMENLWAAAPAALRARAGAAAADITPAILSDLRDGDVIMVKGSNASKISDVVKAITAAAGGGQYPPAAGASQGAA